MKYRYRATLQSTVVVELETDHEDIIIEDEIARLLKEHKNGHFDAPGFEINILDIDVDYDSIKAVENPR